MSESMESEAGSGASEGGFESAGAALGVDLSSGEAIESPTPEVSTETPETPQEDAGWLEPFGVDDRAYIANKGWQSHDAILKSYRAAETHIGGPPADSVQVPDWENPEQVSKFRSQIGVPEQMSEYPELTVETTRGALEMSTMAEISHEIGLTPAQHAKLAEVTGRLVDQTAAQEEANYASKLSAESKEVMAEYGKTPKEFDAMVQRGVTALEITPDEARAVTQALGLKKTVELISKMASATTEKPSVSDGSATGLLGTMSRDVAKQRMKQHMLDEGFRQRMFSGDKDANEEWQGLQAASSTPG
tara:strand:+ start:2198 stop:3109 length:912 start_codon:yes stop_codon:yes gene_type:complete